MFNFKNLTNMKPILLLFTVLSVSLSFAQLPEVEWHEEYEDEKSNELKVTLQTSDGGFILGGSSFPVGNNSRNRNEDFFIIKINALGKLEWKNTYGGDGTDILSEIVISPDGGYLLGGTSNSNKSGDKSQDSYNGTSDYWLIKIDENGNKLWDTTIESSYSPNLDQFYSVHGRYFINGSYGYREGDSVDYVSYNVYQHIEIDNNGMVISNSSHSYEALWYYSTSEDWVFTGDGGRIRVGRVEYDWYANNTLLMFSANGDEIWSKTVGDRYIDIIVNQGVHSTNGNYLIAGTHQYYGRERQPWIAELDANGEYLWQRIYTEKPDMRVRQIISIEDGGYLILSGSEIIKISVNGVIDWEYEIPVEGENYVQSILPHNEGGHLISGNTRGETSEDNRNIWTLKLKSNPINEDNSISDNDLLKINFQDSETIVPEDYVRDVGEAYALRDNGYTYGWMNKDKSAPLSLVGNGRNREKIGVNTLKNTLIHMQYGDVNGPDGIKNEGVWEMEVPNGDYLVNIGAGDVAIDGALTTPSHTINVESFNLINNFKPSGPAGSESRSISAKTAVRITDGKLTIDADRGFNTKINYLTLNPLSKPIYINFSRAEDIPPSGYLKDSGLPFSLRDNGYTYGWLNLEDDTPLDISPNARNRNSYKANALQNTFIHMQYDDTGGTDGIPEDAFWEIEVPNGFYNVKVGIGDPRTKWYNYNSSHSINVEGQNLIVGYLFYGDTDTIDNITSSAQIDVKDGKITIDAIGGHNTKINFIEITSVDYEPVKYSQTLLVNEDIKPGNIVGSINIPGIDLNTFTYEFLNSNDIADFEVDTVEGKIKVINDLNYDTKPEYLLKILVTNGIIKYETYLKVQVKLENYGALKVNFSTADDQAPEGYLKDSGDAFADRLNGYSYGWISTSSDSPINLSANTRNRNLVNTSPLQNTIIHMQYQDVAGANGTPEEGKWEVEMPNGDYQVTIGAGDGGMDGSATIPSHTINAEGVNLISDFVPSGGPGQATRFTSATVEVTVNDGKLTIDAEGGFNTKIDYIEIKPIVSIERTVIEEQKLAVKGIKSNLDSIKLYPNPVSSNLTVQWSGDNTIKDISICDMKGLQIKNFKPQNDNLNTLDISVYQLQAGVYLLNVINTNGEVYKKRFIVK